MKSSGHSLRDVSVGVVISMATLVLAVGIFSIGSEQRLWAKKNTYKIRLADTDGLQVGSPVRLVGVQVGTVTDIVFAEDPNQLDIDVAFSVDAAVAPRMRADTKATLKVLSLLGGDKFLQLSTGSPDQPVLPPGSYVSVPAEMGFAELQAIGATIADDLQSVTASLKVVLEQLQNRNTVIGQALFDPNFGRETLGGLHDSVLSTRDLLRKMDDGKGLAGRLLTDEEFAEEALGSVTNSLDRIESLLGRLADENGVAMKALAEGGSVSRILTNLETSSQSLLASAKKIEEGEGMAGRLVADDAYAEEVLGNIMQVTKDLREITDKLNRGDGTAGALLNDPALYQDLQDIVRGIKKSKTISWLIRHYREKGEKNRLKEGAEESPQSDKG